MSATTTGRFRWTAVMPVAAVLVLAGTVGPAPGRRRRGGAGRGGVGVPGRRRAGRGAPRRGRGPPGRRAVRLPGARGRGHRDRGGADRHAHGVDGQGHLGAGPRHRLRRRDDHAQRDRRHRPARRRPEAPPRELQPRGHRLGAGDGDHPGQRDPGAAPVHDVDAGPGVLRPPSSRSPRSPRWRSTRCSSSPRPCGTATSSCRSRPATDRWTRTATGTRTRPRTARP